MKKFFKDFKDFCVRGNMMTMAIGIIIGSAFTAIVNSLVQDILMPLISLALGGVNLSEKFIPLSEGAKQFATATEAKEAGESVLTYGAFIQAIIVFIITAFVIFLLVKGLAKMSEARKKKTEEEEAPEEPAAPTSEELLTEIRDLLKEKKE